MGKTSEIIEAVVNVLNDVADHPEETEEIGDLWQQAYNDCILAVSEYGSAGKEYVQRLFTETDPANIADLLGIIKEEKR